MVLHLWTPTENDMDGSEKGYLILREMKDQKPATQIELLNKVTSQESFAVAEQIHPAESIAKKERTTVQVTCGTSNLRLVSAKNVMKFLS